MDNDYQYLNNLDRTNNISRKLGRIVIDIKFLQMATVKIIQSIIPLILIAACNFNSATALPIDLRPVSILK